MNTGFIIAEIGWFCSGEHLGAKYADSWLVFEVILFLQYLFKMAIQYILNREWRGVKTLQEVEVSLWQFHSTNGR